MGKRILYISHDARFHGAQMLSVAILSNLKKSHIPTTTMLLDDGELVGQFEAVSEVVRCSGMTDDELDAAISRLRVQHEIAFVNTVVSGKVVRALKRNEFTIISLIHELPGLIESYALAQTARDIANNSDIVVFPSCYVSDCFKSRYGEPKKTLILHQGLYKKPRARLSVSQLFEQRERLGIPRDARVVLGVGFADYRKGIDLFVQCAAEATNASDNIVFVWVGEIHGELIRYVESDREKLGLVDKLFLPGKQYDVSPFYQIADVMLLTSREDPFPSTVLEAMSEGCQVVAFEQSTGAVDLFTKDIGYVVPYMNIKAMARKVVEICGATIDRQQMKNHMRQLACFDAYVQRLLENSGFVSTSLDRRG
jgi:glycosyltransferase involved in cell wall biosynthesis